MRIFSLPSRSLCGVRDCCLGRLSPAFEAMARMLPSAPAHDPSRPPRRAQALDWNRPRGAADRQLRSARVGRRPGPELEALFRRAFRVHEHLGHSEARRFPAAAYLLPQRLVPAADGGAGRQPDALPDHPLSDVLDLRQGRRRLLADRILALPDDQRRLRRAGPLAALPRRPAHRFAGSGLLAAAVLAAFPRHLLASVEFKPDILVILLVLLTFYWTLDAALRPSLARFLAVGLGVGLAVSTKYTGIAAALPITTAVLVNGRRDARQWRWLFLAGLTSV